MLYSSIMKRINNNTKNNNSVGSINIVQFFLRAPNLIKFFFEEIESFNLSEKKIQYPTIYPICLVLTKLLPYDMNDNTDGEEEKPDNLEKENINEGNIIILKK